MPELGLQERFLTEKPIQWLGLDQAECNLATVLFTEDELVLFRIKKRLDIQTESAN